MKLLQLNIWEGRLIKNVMRLIKKEVPEILCLQELASTGSLGAFHGSPLDVIQNEFPYENVSFSPTMDWRLADLIVRYGNGVLSRYPFKVEHTVWLNEGYKADISMKKDRPYNQKNFQHVLVDINGKNLNILNHHGYRIPNTKEGNEVTVENMKKIREYVEGLTGPIILSGDFNLSPQSESMKVFEGVLRDLTQEYGITTTRNEFASRPLEICDFILVNDGVQVSDFRISEHIVSDHAALILDFDI